MDQPTPSSSLPGPATPSMSNPNNDSDIFLLNRYAHVTLDFSSDRQQLLPTIGVMRRNIRPEQLQGLASCARSRLQQGQYICDVPFNLDLMKHLLDQATEIQPVSDMIYRNCLYMLEVLYFSSIGRASFRYMLHEERLNVARLAFSALQNTSGNADFKSQVAQAINLTDIITPVGFTDDEVQAMTLNEHGADATSEMLEVKDELFRRLLCPESFTNIQSTELYEKADRLLHSRASRYLRATCLSLMRNICPSRSVICGSSVVLPKLVRDMEAQWKLDSAMGWSSAGSDAILGEEDVSQRRTNFLAPKVDVEAVSKDEFDGISDADITFNTAKDALEFLNQSRRSLQLPRGVVDDVDLISENKGLYIRQVVKAMIARPKLPEDPDDAEERKVKERMEKSFQDELDRLENPEVAKQTVVAIATLIVDQLIQLHLHGDNLHLSQMAKNVKAVDWTLTASERLNELLHALLHSKNACKDLLHDAGKGAIINLVAAPYTAGRNKFQWAKNNARRSKNAKESKEKLAQYELLAASNKDQGGETNAGATSDGQNEEMTGADATATTTALEAEEGTASAQATNDPSSSTTATSAQDEIMSTSGADRGTAQLTTSLTKTQSGRVSKKSSRKP